MVANIELDTQDTKKPMFELAGANHNLPAYHKQNESALLAGFTLKSQTLQSSNFLQCLTTI